MTVGRVAQLGQQLHGALEIGARDERVSARLPRLELHRLAVHQPQPRLRIQCRVGGGQAQEGGLAGVGRAADDQVAREQPRQVLAAVLVKARRQRLAHAGLLGVKQRPGVAVDVLEGVAADDRDARSRAVLAVGDHAHVRHSQTARHRARRALERVDGLAPRHAHLHPLAGQRHDDLLDAQIAEAGVARRAFDLAPDLGSVEQFVQEVREFGRLVALPNGDDRHRYDDGEESRNRQGGTDEDQAGEEDHERYLEVVAPDKTAGLIGLLGLIRL
jgi:hypothetical protein